MRILADIRQIETIVKILKDSEAELSDGYEYYCKRAPGSVAGMVNRTLEKIAVNIIEGLNKVI